MLKKNNVVTESKLNLDKHISVIKQNCFRLLRLINNLIDVTRIDSGFYGFNLRNYDIIMLIKDVILSVAQFIESKGISLQLSSNVESRIIACDPDKVERVILNILSNAVKFTKQGGNITVNIFDDTDCIVLSLKDTGIGIPEDKFDEIFQRFRQIDKSLTRECEGSSIERGCSNLIYWDKETKVKIVLKSINVLKSETIMKIRLVQQEILTIGR